CGSGNFLYIAYREMRRLEAAIVAKENQLSSRQVPGQMALGGISPRQFFGMDVLPFAVALAKVTLSLAPKLASDELHTTERTLPLANLDDNIRIQDALLTDDGTQTPWPAADIIIGNPPFLGAKRLKPERGADYVNALRKAYPDVPGMADYCVYWFRRAHDHLESCTAANWQAGRAGLVGTQNIRSNQSRVGGLDHIAASGTIVEAVESMPWSGEANVHVSIANWVKNRVIGNTATPSTTGGPAPARKRGKNVTAGGKGTATVANTEDAPAAREVDLGVASADDDASRNIAPIRRLWAKLEATPELLADDSGAKRPKTITLGKRGKVRKDKSYEMAARESEGINASLSDEADISTAIDLSCNTAPQRAFRGLEPGNMGFLVNESTAKKWISGSRMNAKVLRPFLMGQDLVTGDGMPDRWVIDFQRMDQLEARAFQLPFAHVEQHVLEQMQHIAGGPTKRAKDAEFSKRVKGRNLVARLDNWWQLRRNVPATMAMLKTLRRYVVCSLVTKRPIFVFMSSTVGPGNKVQPFAFEDDFSFAVLQSNQHWTWFVARCAKLTERFSYSPESVFDTFPWPQSPSKKQIRAVAAAGREIRAVRAKVLPTMSGGLRALYRTLELPGSNPLKDAHAALDAAVMEAYGFSARKDLLKQLLDLNLSVASSIKRGEPVTAPGVPATYGDPADLITADCIEP
ncbi:MAG: DNA methyltransferase, partial [Phycisphaerales bacterium]